jgi:hypothetical protein
MGKKDLKEGGCKAQKWTQMDGEFAQTGNYKIKIEVLI